MGNFPCVSLLIWVGLRNNGFVLKDQIDFEM